MIDSAYTPDQYTPASGVTSLAVTFYFLDNSHVKVIKTDTGLTQTTLVINTDYTLAGAGDEAGGTVTLLTAANGTDTYTIRRDVPETQLLDYVYNDEFPAGSHEKGLDKLTMLAQQQGEAISRCLRLGEDENGPSELVKVSRSGKVLGFDDDGDVKYYDPDIDVAELEFWGSVKEYGARGDGVYDDTIAINAAIAAEPNLYFPAGTYRVTSTITPRIYTRWLGESPDGTGSKAQLVWDGVAGGTVVGGATSNTKAFRMERIGIDCGDNTSAAQNGAAIGVEMAWFRDCVFREVTVLDPSESGFDLRSSKNGTAFDTPCVKNVMERCVVFAQGDITTAQGANAEAGSVTITGDAITAIAVSAGGSGYSSSNLPEIVIEGDGTGATATAVVTGDAVTGITVNSGGSGYTTATAYITRQRLNNYFCDYGFRLRENANGNTLTSCKSSYAINSFGIYGGDATGDSDRSNQNVLINCSAEPGYHGFYLDSESNIINGGRVEGCLFGVRWGDSTYAQYNVVIGVTAYVGGTLNEKFMDIPSESSGPNIIIDPEEGYKGAFDFTSSVMRFDTPSGGVSARWGRSGNAAMFQSGLNDGLKFQAFNSTFQDLLYLYKHVASGSTRPVQLKVNDTAAFTVPAGATASRPDLTNIISSNDQGTLFFDTTLGKLIVHNGSTWVNADGTAL